MATSLPTLTDYAGAGGQYAGGVIGIAQGVPGIPTTPLLPTGTNLPTNPDGNVAAPPNVGATPGSAAQPAVVPVIAPAPAPSFWDEHGDTVTAGLAIVDVVALAAYVLGKVRVSQ